MNWDAIKSNPETQKTLLHWQKLGQFRKNHPSVGAGIHKQISAQPYTFSRTFSKEDYSDAVVVGLDLAIGTKELFVGSIFAEGKLLKDAYSGKEAIVSNGKVTIDTEFNIVLLELKK
jgi:alpha-amylase